MGADFSSTEELRLWSLEQKQNTNNQLLNSLARSVAALQQAFQQLAGQQGSQNGTAATGARPATTASGGISAASGSTPGSGSVTIYKRNPSTGNLSSLGTVTCYSWFTSVVGSGGKNIMVTRDPEGNYWAYSEDC